MTPRISIAMCTYNGERFLYQQLESIVSQSLQPFEVVICDDASTDTTLEIVQAFCERAPFQVRIVSNAETLGSTKNFEQAIQLCNGDFIALCDQDDIWLPHKLERLFEVLQENSSLGGVFSDADLIDDESRPIGKSIWTTHNFRFQRHPQRDFDRAAAIDLLLKHDVVTGATLMIRADSREFIMPIPPSWVHDGWIAWMLVLYSRLSFVNLSLLQYRVHTRQQLGIGVSSLRGRLRHARRIGTERFESASKQFQGLRERWVSHPGDGFDILLKAIEGKIAFLDQRARSSKNRFFRACYLLRLFRCYRRYARGFRSMRKDIVVLLLRD